MPSSLTFAVPIDWSSSRTYEINNIVFVGKRAYTALKNVPTGIEITNTEYWKETGVPYVDVSAIYNRLTSIESDVSENTDDIEQAQSDIITNSNSITNLTTRLNTAVTNLESEVSRVNNIMITLYTPPSS